MVKLLKLFSHNNHMQAQIRSDLTTNHPAVLEFFERRAVMVTDTTEVHYKLIRDQREVDCLRGLSSEYDLVFTDNLEWQAERMAGPFLQRLVKPLAPQPAAKPPMPQRP